MNAEINVSNAATKAKAGFFRRIVQAREFMVLIIVLCVGILLALASPYFLNSTNFLALLLGLSVEGIIACAMTMVIITGGIDLSVGSTVALTGAITAYSIRAGVPIAAAILLGLLTGVVIGLLNGLMIAKVGINAFIITLGMMNVTRGLTLILVGGLNIANLPPAFTVLGQGKILGIQYPIIVMIILVVLGDLLLRKFRYFRQSYYVGNNEKAAALSGINVAKVKITNYVICGAMGAVAGILMTARLASATATAGTSLEMRVITAVILGGASLSGGEGSILGAFLGALLMGLISNGLNLLSIDVYWQTFTLGAVLLLAVMVDNFKNKKK